MRITKIVNEEKAKYYYELLIIVKYLQDIVFTENCNLQTTI